MVPCYTCLDQSVPADPTRQSSTLDLPQIAHHLYSINTATYKHPNTIMHSKLFTPKFGRGTQEFKGFQNRAHQGIDCTRVDIS